MRALAVAGAQRAGALPDLPTVAEAGLPGFAAEAWFGLVGPAAMSRVAQERAISLVRAALSDDAFRGRLATAGAEPGLLFGDAFGEFMAREREVWSGVIEASGARAD